MLKNWEFDPDHVDEMLSYYRISSNAIYPYLNKGQVCFLRFAPVDEKKHQNLDGELEFIHFLRGKGYNALEPIKSRSDEYRIFRSTGACEYYATAFKKVPGQPISQTDFSDKIMYQYGRALGNLHRLSNSYAPHSKRWAYDDCLEWIRKVFAEYSVEQAALVEYDALSRLLSKVPVDQRDYGLVHYDFEPDNVFYDVTMDNCWVIDFDDCMYHWYAADIEQACSSIIDEIGEDKGLKCREQFLNGYQSEWLISAGTMELLPLMRRFINLYSYARIIRSTSEVLNNEPEWLIELREKLETIKASLLNNMS